MDKDRRNFMKKAAVGLTGAKVGAFLSFQIYGTSVSEFLVTMNSILLGIRITL